MISYISSLEQLQSIKQSEQLSFVYFKNDKCAVCNSLLPQISSKINTWNEEVFVVDCAEYPEIAAQSMVLSVPALKVFYMGQEVISMIRFVDMAKLETDYLRIKKIIE